MPTSRIRKRGESIIKKVSMFNENKASQPLSCSIQKFLSRKEKKEEEDLFNKLAKESGIFGV